MAPPPPPPHSAIPGMSVPNVRRALADLRTRWAQHSPVDLMRLSDQLVHDLMIAEFAHHFVLGHHQKRHKQRSA